MKLTQPIEIFLPDTRDVEISRYGFGNLKLGMGVFTYSRIAGNPYLYNYKTAAIFPNANNGVPVPTNPGGTCPGSTPECESICYAKRIGGPVREVYERNAGDDVPPIPDACQILRLHVSGDFDTSAYISNWVDRLIERSDVTCWAYTRSWRIPHLVAALEDLRALPNVQLFASMDRSHRDEPPNGWRRAWLDGDPRAGFSIDVTTQDDIGTRRLSRTLTGVSSYVCPEETGHKKDCLACGYCFEGQTNDVTFLKH